MFCRNAKQRPVNFICNQNEIQDDKKDCFSLHTTQQDQSVEPNYFALMEVEGQAVNFKVDTGSEVNVLPQKLLLGMSKVNLHKSTTRLMAYNGMHIRSIGKACLLTLWQNRYHPITYEVIAEDRCPIIGAQTIDSLGLIKKLFSLADDVKLPSLIHKFSDVFEGLGKLPGAYHIEIDHTVQPVVHPPRKLPFAMVERVQAELSNMEKSGIISRQIKPTPRVNSMVVVEKPNKLRICIDPKDLNKAIMRPHYPMKTVEVATRLAEAEFFTVLDASQAFYQVKLDHESSLLTTFNTPFGRFAFKRLPFGISSAPEEFQRRATEIIEGLEGVDVIIDDILIWGRTKQEHDKRLESVLQRFRIANLKLSVKKSRFAVSEVKYIGHIFSKSGVKPDPVKVSAISSFPPPEDEQQLLRFMGMINYLGKFIPDMSESNKPLRDLLKNDVSWHWEQAQQQSFDRLKRAISTAPVLKFYDLFRPVILSVDASFYGLGACLLQDGQPVAYTSRSLSSAERVYSHIKKETLAIVFGFDKFHHYLYGRSDVKVESDHQPLESLFKNNCKLRHPVFSV